MPGKKDYVSVNKRVHKQNLATCKNLCNLQELYTAFKEKHANVNIGFSYWVSGTLWIKNIDNRYSYLRRIQRDFD